MNGSYFDLSLLSAGHEFPVLGSVEMFGNGIADFSPEQLIAIYQIIQGGYAHHIATPYVSVRSTSPNTHFLEGYDLRDPLVHIFKSYRFFFGETFDFQPFLRVTKEVRRYQVVDSELPPYLNLDHLKQLYNLKDHLPPTKLDGTLQSIPKGRININGTSYNIRRWNANSFMINKRGQPPIAEGAYKTVREALLIHISSSASGDVVSFRLEDKVRIQDRGKNLSPDQRVNFLNPVLNGLSHPNLDIPTKSNVRSRGPKGQLYVTDRALCNLGSLLENEPVEIDRLTKIAEGVLKGFNYLHQNNIVHGDIQPGNCVIFKDGSVKIIDLDNACHESGEPISAIFKQHIFFLPLVIRHAILKKSKTSILDLDNSKYEALWPIADFSYIVTRKSERTSIGLFLAYLYYHIVEDHPHTLSEKEVKWEKAIKGLCSYSVRNKKGDLFPDITDFFRYVDRDLSRRRQTTAHAKTSLAISIDVALGIYTK
jgi:hypothetical protein